VNGGNKRKILFIGIIIVLSLALFSATISAARIAVIGFESGGLPWTDNQELERDILEQITQKYSNMLVENDFGTVVERARVRDVLSQFDHSIGDSFHAGYSSQVGRMTESNLLIIGSLDRLRVTEEGSISVGPLKLSGIASEVELSARLINIASGDVIATFSGKGSASDTGLEISEIEGLSIGSGAFADSAVGKALDSAIEDLFAATLEKRDKFEVEEIVPEDLVIEAEVIAIVGESLVIDKGSDDEIVADITGSLSRDISEGDDPLIVTIGSVEVASVDAATALVRTTETHEKPEVGDLVKLDLLDTAGISEDREQVGFAFDVIREIETPDFIVYIESVVLSRNKVTISGTAEAKEESTLTLISLFAGSNSFYDHMGVERRPHANRVYISERSGNRTTRALILPGYPQRIRWEFSNVPEDADHLTRLRLHFETEAVGEVEINLDGIELMTF